MQDIRSIVRCCMAGDSAAVVALVNRYTDTVFGLCYRMLGQRQDAEDMTQETFVRALRSLKRWYATREFRPWLLAIAGNRCRTLLAKRRRRPELHHLPDSVPDRSPDLQAARHLAEEVDRALLMLREEHRMAFCLFHEQQLSYEEIGDVLGCPLGTVKTWVRRARCGVVDELLRRGVIEETRHAMRRA
ncbi:MAG: RNA polymerase sigma factor [Pirellulales bacterium]